MSKGILVAGNDSALLVAVETEIVRRMERYVFAAIPNRFSTAATAKSPAANDYLEKVRIPLAWNAGSSIATRALVRDAGNRLGRIDRAILVCSPPAVGCRVADIKPVDVEVLASDCVKSWFFLVMELAAVFRANGGGLLAMVFREERCAADALGSAAAASFRSLATRVLSSASGEGYSANGFSTDKVGNDAAFAAFVFKKLDSERRRADGRLYRY